ncbi:MAG: hypothetical protein J5509_03335 [Lachnospiraceae bacterium]|nr:hypothetical protein [Lachnospiraceae bacterium]
MNIVIVAPKNGRFEKDKENIKAKHEARGDKCFFIFRAQGDTRNIMVDIRSYEPDLLITEDLEGFEMCTLTDAVSYNLIHCRQYHYIYSEHPANEKYLAKQLSLVMTFICPDEEMASRFRTRYPDLPEVVPGTILLW